MRGHEFKMIWFFTDTEMGNYYPINGRTYFCARLQDEKYCRYALFMIYCLIRVAI